MERNIGKMQSPLIEHQGTREQFSREGAVDIVFRELPFEFAVEATRLMDLNLEGSVG